MEKKRRMSLENASDCDEIPGTPIVKKYKRKCSEKLNKNSQTTNEIIKLKEDNNLFSSEDECFDDLLFGISLDPEESTKSQPLVNTLSSC